MWDWRDKLWPLSAYAGWAVLAVLAVAVYWLILP